MGLQRKRQNSADRVTAFKGVSNCLVDGYWIGEPALNRQQ